MDLSASTNGSPLVLLGQQTSTQSLCHLEPLTPKSRGRSLCELFIISMSGCGPGRDAQCPPLAAL